MCIDWVVYMLCVCIHWFVWDEIGDVLHGLGGDRGWTPKPDFIWVKIGDGLHWYSKSLYHLWSMKCFNMSCYLMWIVKYGSVLLWVTISFKLLILERIMDILVMDLDCVVCWFIWVKHLSNANVLVIAHIMFIISLLGVGSPYMGHHFQVQVICLLQGCSLGGCRSWRLPFCDYFVCK